GAAARWTGEKPSSPPRLDRRTRASSLCEVADPSQGTDPANGLANERTRVAQPQYFLVISRAKWPKNKVANGADGTARPGRNRSFATSATDQMIDLSPPPAAAHAQTVAGHRCNPVAQGRSRQQQREVDSSIDGELERAPEPSVHFHQIRLACNQITLVLDHSHAAPAEALEQLSRTVAQLLVDSDALSITADSSRGRLLAEAA